MPSHKTKMTRLSDHDQSGAHTSGLPLSSGPPTLLSPSLPPPSPRSPARVPGWADGTPSRLTVEVVEPRLRVERTSGRDAALRGRRRNRPLRERLVALVRLAMRAWRQAELGRPLQAPPARPPDAVQRRRQRGEAQHPAAAAGTTPRHAERHRLQGKRQICEKS